MSQVVLVTGASRGFGKDLVKTLAPEGYRVIASMRGVADKNKEAADELRAFAEENNYQIDVLELDVTSQESVDAAFEVIKGLTGSIDVLVNNAGVGLMGLVESTTIDTIKFVWDVNYFGLIRVTQSALPLFKAQGSGLIINIGSGLAAFSTPLLTYYSATKAAVHSISEAWRLELADLGIETIIVHPGAYATEFGSNSQRNLSPELLPDYPKIGQMLQAFASGSHNDEINQVAQAVLNAIKQEHGKRDFCTWVGLPNGDQAAQWSDIKWEMSKNLSAAFSGGVDFTVVKTKE